MVSDWLRLVQNQSENSRYNLILVYFNKIRQFTSVCMWPAHGWVGNLNAIYVTLNHLPRLTLSRFAHTVSGIASHILFERHNGEPPGASYLDTFDLNMFHIFLIRIYDLINQFYVWSNVEFWISIIFLLFITTPSHQPIPPHLLPPHPSARWNMRNFR